MSFLKAWKLLFVVSMIWWSCSPLMIEELGEEQPHVVLSLGSIISPVDSVLIYDEVEHAFFLISDIPEPPSLTDIKCPDEMDSPMCKLFEDSKAALLDIQKELKVTNR
ncbi:unnamed protein product [Orchesella dallaii]|uniref:Lipoprotein n=1 Tax=Orchesella dallaii TaxID=48710 RepID=A0ABP1Q3Z6_9HEXA